MANRPRGTWWPDLVVVPFRWMSASTKESSESSLAERLAKLPPQQVKKQLAKLSEGEAEALLYDWDFWSRPSQRTPPGDWSTWLVMAGRGFGKTRVGAEQVRKWVRDFPIVNLIGRTAGDVRDVMVSGSAGSSILEICPPNERPVYTPSKKRLDWPNGAVSLLFSADNPESLRGPQCCKMWGDELAAWRYQDEAKEQIDFNLRLGSSPQMIATTTPRPTALMRELVASKHTFITSGSTYENRTNLAPRWFSNVITKYENTRLGRQELNAELLLDNPGALWKLAAIDADRVKKFPTLTRIVVGVDPSVTSGEDSAECGIVVAGEGPSPTGQAWPPHYYVLDDLSQQASPDTWAQLVVGAYATHQADRIVAEINNGGDLVEAILRTKNLEVAYKGVHASRGKLTRAEPIAALYEQHRVHHVGGFPILEDQMCDYVPLSGKRSPDRMDALVWGLWALNESEEEVSVVTYEEDFTITPELDDYN